MAKLMDRQYHQAVSTAQTSLGPRLSIGFVYPPPNRDGRIPNLLKVHVTGGLYPAPDFQLVAIRSLGVQSSEIEAISIPTYLVWQAASLRAGVVA